MSGSVLIMPLDYLSCFAVILRRIQGKADICQTDYSIHSKLRILSYSGGKYNIQANERLTKIKEIWCFCFFIFFVPMFQTIGLINTSGGCYFLHASNYWCVCWCVRVRSHASNGKDWTDIFDSRVIFCIMWDICWKVTCRCKLLIYQNHFDSKL